MTEPEPGVEPIEWVEQLGVGRVFGWDAHGRHVDENGSIIKPLTPEEVEFMHTCHALAAITRYTPEEIAEDLRRTQ